VAGTNRWSALRDGIKRGNRRPVVVTSPHPPEECLRRLAKVTPDGGTTLTGTVGVPGVWVGPVVGLVALVIWTGVAVVIAASGHLIPGVGVAIALPVLVLIAILADRARKPDPGAERKEAPTPALLRKINSVLDSTSVFPG
jgi:hypothetical protein